MAKKPNEKTAGKTKREDVKQKDSSSKELDNLLSSLQEKYGEGAIMKFGEVRFVRGRPKFVGAIHGLPQPLAIVVFRGASVPNDDISHNRD